MKEKRIALVGNPNVGKSTLFNLLTGLRQKTGNYPGMTVEKKTGIFFHRDFKFHLIDLPGIYGIYPTSLDEQVVVDVLNNPAHPNFPEFVVVVGEAGNLKRSVFLFQQIRDLGFPAVFVLNMMDEAEKSGIQINRELLNEKLQTEVVFTDARNGTGIEELKNSLLEKIEPINSEFKIPKEFSAAKEEIQSVFPEKNEYRLWQLLAQKEIKNLAKEQKTELETIRKNHQIIPRRLQVKETLNRYESLRETLENTFTRTEKQKVSFSEKTDRILIHPVFGYLIFFGLLMLIFQAVFAWSGPFMDGIDMGFAWINENINSVLPQGPLSGLLTDGIISGIGGIVIFIPQIVILFLFISIMEESGYMSRVVYLMDRILKPFGLSGKSAVPLMSGAACAIPAVMSARNIENDKERLITILVTPFMTCSARLPIYVIIIGLVIPETTFYGINIQGIALLCMYLLGIFAALGSAWILKKVIKSNFKSYLILELPTYKLPVWRNVLITVYEKSMGFVLGAGKIILAISIVLWVLGSFGFSEEFKNAEEIVQNSNPNLNQKEFENEVASYKLEHSVLGNLGHVIEPVIKPLGYDWKMGIGLISSFAAREVFVGTMATVYSLGDTDDRLTIRDRMAKEKNPDTGEPAYSLPTGISLLIFYAFAMQCMSTIAVVKKETDSWKWTLVQWVFMSGLAYAAALVAYQVLK
jgi:ferrous iron transport protein B